MNFTKKLLLLALAVPALQILPAQDSIKTKQLTDVLVESNRTKKYADTISFAGTKTNLRLLETPQTIQVITHDIIQDQQAQNLNDVVKNMTGVIANNMYTSYTMRGFLNSYYNQFITFDGYIGNTYQAWTQMVQLYNIDKVEEIAGPAAALFSTGSPGGVINMTTKRPLATPMYSFNVTTGSWNLFDISADLTGPLTRNKKLLYRLNVGYNHQNSFRPSQFNDNLVVSPSLTYNISDKTSLSLDYTYALNNSRFGEDHGGLLLMNKDSTYNWKGVNNQFLFNSPKDYSHITNNNLTLRISHRFNPHIELNYMARYIWSYQNTGEHYGNYYTNNYLTTLPDSMQRNYDTWNYKPYNFQNSLFAVFKAGPAVFNQTIVTGADFQLYGDRHNRYVDGPADPVSFVAPDYSHDNFNYAITPETYVYDVRSYNRQIGLYAQDLISIKNKIKILLALRYENFLFTIKPSSADTYVTNDTSNANVLLPRAGIVYNPVHNHAIYASYCESFMPQYDNARSSGGPFPPQKGRQVEIGHKGEYLGGSLISSVALYYINFINILATDPKDSTGVRQIVLPGVNSLGAEFTLQGKINEQLSIIAGYAYNHVVFLANSPLGPKGGRYDNAPNHVANLWARYSFPVRTKLKGLSLSLGGKFVGNRCGWATNQHFIMPAYFVLDAAINYHVGPVNVALNGFNLTNARYVSGYYSSDLMVQVGTPINWKLSITYTIK